MQSALGVKRHRNQIWSRIKMSIFLCLSSQWQYHAGGGTVEEHLAKINFLIYPNLMRKFRVWVRDF